jgi:hypothetical protein
MVVGEWLVEALIGLIWQVVGFQGFDVRGQRLELFSEILSLLSSDLCSLKKRSFNEVQTYVTYI